MKKSTKSLEERDALVNQWLGLPYYVFNTQLANHPVVRCVGEEEAICLGNMGLIRAAELYDPTRGVKFNTYAVTAIRNYVVQHARDQISLIRIPAYQFDRRQYKIREKFKEFVDRAMGCTTFPKEDWGYSEAPKIPEIDWDCDRDTLDKVNWLEKALNNLPPRDSFILRKRFYEGKHLNQIAKELGCSKERVRQLQNRALKEIRGSVKGDKDV